ncbi:dihydroneopterin aldolase [Candidatus Sumerlaeota bacterium]|nr:dihydroneopterin aldolase [Candidatus Sumerlaeota bacterium]
MDCIKLANMGFYAFHGTTSAEKQVGQRFYLDVELFLDLRPAGASDNIRDTINYEKVYEIISEVTKRKKYNLLEALAEDIVDEILNHYPKLERIRVKVRKPQVPLCGILDYVEVIIDRGNSDTLNEKQKGMNGE